MNKSDNYKTIPDYFFHRDNRIDDRHDIADKFNKYFADIGNEISNSVPQSNYNFQKIKYIDQMNIACLWTQLHQLTYIQQPVK